MDEEVEQRPQGVAPHMNQPEFKRHVEALYPELVRYARGRLNGLHVSADPAADVAHTAIVDLLGSGGYERCVTQDDVLAVLRTAIKHDAIDELRDPARRHRRLRTFRDDQWDDEAGRRLSGFDAREDGGAEKDTVDLNGMPARSPSSSARTDQVGPPRRSPTP
jgi:DNA-directed RNA polymerase specialized sigma24 family protein